MLPSSILHNTFPHLSVSGSAGFWLGLSIGLSMLIHELGHLVAARSCRVAASEIGLGLGPKLVSLRLGPMRFSLRLFPIASFLRLDGSQLKQCTVPQQLFVHLGGVGLNLLVGTMTFGTVIGWLNILLAAANLLPIYQHDGWKCGVVIMRALLGRTSQPVEWAFTFSGGFASLVMVGVIFRLFI